VALLVTLSPVSAAEFSAQIVDGLNRPVAGVQFVVFCGSSGNKTTPLYFASDGNGWCAGPMMPPYVVRRGPA
jgi:hypothetical protein